jgi:N-glycosylase/DNA lyase
MIVKISKDEFKGPFNLKITLNSQQCPSDIWHAANRKYKAFIKINMKWTAVTIWEDPDTLFIDSVKNVSKEILYHFWSDYDIPDFYSRFKSDAYLSRVIGTAQGLRVMRNLDVYWGIIEALCTQNSSVKQIRKMESNLRRFYGNGYTFDLRKIANADEKELQRKCRVGYRAKYIINVAKKILNEELNIEKIKRMSSENARKLLSKIEGIGPKVADIILLYSFGKQEAFPMDVWLKRALIREYFDGKRTTDKKLREFALNYFGKHAGVAHLYMFYYERKIA